MCLNSPKIFQTLSHFSVKRTIKLEVLLDKAQNGRDKLLWSITLGLRLCFTCSFDVNYYEI